MKRVVHLIPYDAIGGVEIAAKSLPTGNMGTLQFERQYLVRMSGAIPEVGEHHGPVVTPNSPRAYWLAFWRLYSHPPDLLVASLWRSALLLICLKVLRPRMQAVLFLHNSHDVNLVDKVVNKIAMKLSDGIWADSSATLKGRVPRRLQSKGRVISFLLKSRVLRQPCDPMPIFIFWGRLNAQKGLERALKLFAGIFQRRHDARFVIIGPDGGMEAELRMLVSELRLGGQVTFKGPMPQDEIVCEAAQASFYLQTSRDEGMAMAVVEAMQAGLVPVVTPVGEIACYCQDGESAIFVQDDVSATNAVLALLSEPERFRRISRAAAEFWQEKPLYRDDFLAAAKDLIEGREHEV